VSAPERDAPVSSAASSSEEDPRQLGARVVNAIYRLIKACQLHSENNQAVAQVVDFALSASHAYLDRVGMREVSVLFTKAAIFVNRQMLRSSRETYQLALELGTMLEQFEVTEITLTRETTAAELAEFGRMVSEFQREAKRHPRLFEGGWDGLRLRRVIGFSHGADLSPPTRAARTYAAALMLVRGFYSDIRAGNYELKQGIKRVAQKLVSQNDTGARLLVTIAATPAADADRAGQLLGTAILAVAMASQITEDPTLLTALASAALLYDAGRQRLVGYSADEGRAQRTLNEDEEALMPTSAVVALTALGKVHPPAITRTVIVHEALALRDGGVPHGGRRQPALLSRVLHVARSFIELRTPRATTQPIAIDDALEILESQAGDNTGRALVKLLTGALGVFPAGTMVELSTGEMAVVLATPKLPVDFARPPVRVMYDAHAQLLGDAFDVDLAEMREPGQPIRFIVRTVDATDQQMKQMRAYVVQLSQKRARKRSVDKMQAVAPPTQREAAPAPAPGPTVAPPAGRKPTSSRDARLEDDAFPSDGPPVVATVDAKAGSASTRNVSWHDYEHELAAASKRIVAVEAPASSQRGEPPVHSPAPASATDALLAAYLAEEAAGATPDGSAEPMSSGGRPSHGLRWGGDRPSNQGTGSSDAFGAGGRNVTGASSSGFSADRGQTPVSQAFGSVGRGVTGAPPSFGFGSAARGVTGASGFGAAGRSVTGASGFGSAGRGNTASSSVGSSSSGFGSDARSSTGSGFNSPGRSTTGGGHGLRIGGSSPGREVGATSDLPPVVRSNDASADSSVRSAPQPLRGSLGRATTASSWASPQKPEAAAAAPPQSEEVPKTSDTSPATGAQADPVPSRRAKAGTTSWGKK
jgi:hypothetical protein